MVKTIVIGLIIFLSINAYSGERNDSTSVIENIKIENQENLIKSYETYLTKLNTFVTIAFVIFGLAIGLNFASGYANMNRTNNQLQKIDEKIIELDAILKDSKDEKERLIKDYENKKNELIFDFQQRIQAENIVTSLEKILTKDSPNEELIFKQLSSVINLKDKRVLSLFTTCLERFHHNTDIYRLCITGLKHYQTN